MRVCCTTAGRGGVAFYRIIQPYTYISQFVDVFICDPAVHHKQRIDDEMEAADVIVFQMPFGEHYYKEIMKNKQRIKPKKIVLEFDDNIFHIHPLNTAYKAYGQEEVLKYYALGEDIDKAEAHIVSSGMNLKVERFKPGEMEIDGRPIAGRVELHKDGVDGFDLKANQLRMAYTIKSVMEADMVTCTVEHLGKQFRKYRKGPIAILPNFVDCDRFLEMKKHGTDEIRIGWQGGCVDDKTEILTKNGFKYFKDLKTEDFVATVNSSGNLEYHQPKRIINEPYSGDMYYYDDNGVNFALTPEHRVYHRKRFNWSKYRFKNMESLYGSNFRLKKDCIWNGADIKQITIADKIFEIDDFLKFFGLWIAEGWTTTTKFKGKKNLNNLMQVGIRQVKDNGILNEMYSILSKYYSVKLEKEKGQLRIFNKELWGYFRKLGKSEEKFIPEEIKSLSSDKLKILLEWYIKGDGHVEKSGRTRAWTVSKKLADDLCEISLKVGWSANVENRGKRDSVIRGRKIIARNDCYQINFLRNNIKFSRLEPLVKSKNISIKKYTGRKYCVEVENGTWLLRREGKMHWTGNSAHFQDLHMIREVMWQIMDKYPNVKFVIQGAGFTGIFPDKYKDRVEWKPWHSDVNTFPLATRDLACDIGICPVIDDNFNRSKSELKFLEFSAMKVPTVCSHVTYWHAVKHAKTGFLAKNNKEWFEYLCELIEKPELRKQMGEKAYDRIKGYHNVDQSIMWLDMLNDLTGKIIKPVL